MWKPEGKRPLGNPKQGYKNNVKMKLKEVVCGGKGWIDLAEERDSCWALVNAVTKFRVP
jgi:hypothetical protein